MEDYSTVNCGSGVVSYEHIDWLLTNAGCAAVLSPKKWLSLRTCIFTKYISVFIYVTSIVAFGVFLFIKYAVL